MNDLVIMRDKQAVTSSLQVADTFGKDHGHVLRDIDNLMAEFSATKSGNPKLDSQMFAEGTYKDKSVAGTTVVWLPKIGGRKLGHENNLSR